MTTCDRDHRSASDGHPNICQSDKWWSCPEGLVEPGRPDLRRKILSSNFLLSAAGARMFQISTFDVVQPGGLGLKIENLPLHAK